jgi:YidC/Oxa1 family membrane protein insertase
MIYANVLQPLIDVFENVLRFFHDSIGVSWGLSIIALTIVVRALLLPLAVKQFRSMHALQRIAPQLKQLQEKYKGDKQRLQQETMKFYSEHKVNPFASCLPLVAQLPVFLSLFYMLRKDLRHDICPEINPAHVSNPVPCGASQHSEFFFIPDITNKATGAVLVVLIVLYVGSQLVSSLLMMSATQDKNQRMIMLALPFVFVPFIFSFPAGLLMYWITTNVWTIGQQQFLRRIIGKNETPATLAAAAGGDGGATTTDVEAAPVKRRRGGASVNGGAAEQETVDAARGSKAPPPPPRRKRKRSGRRR